MYRPNIRVKFIYRLYRIRNTIQQREGRTLSFTDMIEEALSAYLFRKEKQIDLTRELPEEKLYGKWYFRDDRLGEYRNIDNPHDRITFDELNSN